MASGEIVAGALAPHPPHLGDPARRTRALPLGTVEPQFSELIRIARQLSDLVHPELLAARFEVLVEYLQDPGKRRDGAPVRGS